MLRKRQVLALLLATAFVPVQARRVDGLEFADVAQVGGQQLRLNGVGFRAVAGFKGYGAGLYLQERATTAAQVTAQPGPKRLQLRMLYDVASVEFSKAFLKGVKRNTPPDQWLAMAERVKAFDQQVLGIGQVRKGDLVNLDFVPGQGLTMTLNGKPRGAPVPGEDLYAGLLRAFVGDRPYDSGLKTGLLGA